MRVPGIFWWPGRIPAGVVQREMASTLELLPTCARLAGAPRPETRLDGTDLSPLLFATGTPARGAFFYYRGTTLYAARQDPWKAHFITRSAYGPDLPVTRAPPLLFHLGEDPGERWDRAARQPAVLDAVQAAVDRHRATLVPVTNQLEATLPNP